MSDIIPEWVSRLSKNQRELYLFLSNPQNRRVAKSGWTIRELSDKFPQIKYLTISRALNKFHKEGVVKKTVIVGNIHRYTFKSTPKSLISSTGSHHYTSWTPPEIVALLSKMEETWNPKIFTSAKFLPHAVARYYELAYDAANGGIVDPLELSKIQVDINVFKRDLEATLMIVNNLLATAELTDVKEFASFLLSVNESPDLLLAKARRARERN